MISACVFGTLLGHPNSPAVRALPDPVVRRVLMGLAMGLTAISLIYSPWGQRSGAHFNPATTLTFWRLGKLSTADAAFYVLFQVLGGIGGVYVAAIALGDLVGHPSVQYVATVPGDAGVAAAFAAEVLIAFILMSVVLRVSNTAGLARFTPLFAGALVAIYISVEAPISGMSMNPARSLASAIPAQAWASLWIYWVAPPLGMLLAAQVYVTASRTGSGLLRQAPPRQSEALHLPLPLRGAGGGPPGIHDAWHCARRLPATRLKGASPWPPTTT